MRAAAFIEDATPIYTQVLAKIPRPRHVPLTYARLVVLAETDAEVGTVGGAEEPE